MTCTEEPLPCFEMESDICVLSFDCELYEISCNLALHNIKCHRDKGDKMKTADGSLIDIPEDIAYIKDGWFYIKDYRIKLGKKDATISYENNILVVQMGRHDGDVQQKQFNPEKQEYEWASQWSFSIWEGRGTFIEFV